MTKSYESMSPADNAEGLGSRKAVAGAVAPQPLAGIWVNGDTTTRGLVRVVIETAGNNILVHAFGACSPTPCDFGTVNGLVFAGNAAGTAAEAFNAQYKFSFKQTLVIGYLYEGTLIVETFDHFTDGSARSDYHSRCYMHR